ncbi:HAUS augmin-like complex subunit 6 N-terminus-domain-containing protein [Talaromyces proteolyticus]|uniref:HAUS augmin-like complex subunit 6 N-terminus-domain-containing protein n=1 Tax=Talaromyces proteolyticus TaxID=1131652 RepID=A0AAD4KI21_9EURO|nr:HAUS augmin-like complex subunit 6 N-terminus-domain-containing protein [Talaromyces proteolyticus]KAH8691579.1 HAUS augmin-like complex subunit 6 N-terminus-domain-containing protein [Talaromyces proteolyticus]
MQASRAPAPSWSTPSPVTVFLRNVHLLRLDQQPDWPALSAKLFSGGQSTQLQRVKGVESALYHLFSLWDPAETKTKLRPFFPPLEPLQSINLRAALFRALSDLKKNGDLGRETIVRKTMLDDCKGAKFEEVLAVFSTAVLRRLVSQSQIEPGLRLAFAQAVTHQEIELFVPLILAHHSALENTRQHRSKVRENYRRFSDLLDAKSEELSARSNKNIQADDAPYAERLELEVRANWLGSQGWVDALLNGGSHIETDAFLELPFETAWSQAKNANIDDLVRPTHPGLVRDVNSWIAESRYRLQRLNDLKASIRKIDTESGIKVPARTQAKSNSLVFKDHLTLTVASISKGAQETTHTPVIVEEHRDIISSLKETLAQIDGGETENTEQAQKIHPRLLERLPGNKFSHNIHALSPIPDSDQYSRSPSPNIQVITPEHETRPMTPDSHDKPAFTQSLSDIDDSVNMPVVDSLDQPMVQDESPNLEQQSSPPEPKLPVLPSDKFEHRPSSLLERTRQSMSLLPPLPTNRSRQSLAARRQTRQSQIFSINQFETPPKERHSLSGSGASTPRDDLFSEDADYASVFKSRPRIAQSPLMSPAVHVGLDTNEGVYEEDESVIDLAADGSPLPRRMR